MSDESPSATLAQKSKKKSASKKSSKQTQSGDLIADTAQTIEGLSKHEAFTRADELADSVEFNYFQLGGVLSLIQANSWYAEEGYSKMGDFVAERFGMQYRKAMYLINIYESLVEAEIPFGSVSHLGWTKLIELVGVITADSVDFWVEVAENRTVLDLREYVKAYKAKHEGLDSHTSEEQLDAKKAYSMNFKVFEDQKSIIDDAIKQIMEELGTESKGQALEALCTHYLSGGKASGKQPKVTPALLKKTGLNPVLEALDEAFSDVEIEVTFNESEGESA